MNTWEYMELRRGGDPRGSGIVEKNFQTEDLSFAQTFTRETMQNTKDAANSEGSVRVKVQILDAGNGLDESYLDECLKDLKPRLIAGNEINRDNLEKLTPKVLVYEEFNTTGLIGKTNDSFADGEAERWANFWHGEGKRAKGGASLGRAGQGKITYHMASEVKTLLSWSVRGNESPGCLYGKCIFKSDYEFNEKRWTRHAHWCNTDKNDPDAQTLPCEEDFEVQRFKKAFKLSRDLGQSGTSFVFPYPRKSLSKENLIDALVRQFYYSILCRGIVVEICDELIDADTIEYFLPHDFPKTFFNFVREITTSGKQTDATIGKNWQTKNTLEPDIFIPSEFEPLREKFEAGKIVGVKMPVFVYPKGKKEKESFICVFLQCNDDLVENTEELFVRSELSIGNEKWLHTQAGRVFGLCIAEDETISNFLGHAEEASHMKWNSNEEEVNIRFDKVDSTLRAVRQSSVRLYRCLKGLNKGRQEDMFLNILSIPGGKKKKKKSKKKTRKETPEKPELKPEKNKKAVQIKELKDNVIEICKGDQPISKYPLEGTLECAFDRLDGDGNPFAKYHRLDFDFSEPRFSTKEKNLEIISMDKNKIELLIKDADFSLKIFGFSPDKDPVRTKFTYSNTSS